MARNRVSLIQRPGRDAVSQPHARRFRAVIHPTVETERLVLRPWRPAEDLDALVALNADPAVMR